MKVNSNIIPIQSTFDGKYNFLKDGRIISEKWFLKVLAFCEGTAIVMLDNGTWHKIDENGNVVE